ncbi:MAG: hypothetical protein ACFE0O_07250 [Opitutales bacterium]
MAEQLTVFRTEESVTISFRDRVHTIFKGEPFWNIAQVALQKDDMVPFYVELARREGVGPEFRDQLRRQVEDLQGDWPEDL